MKISSFKYLISLGTKSVWVNRMMSFASFCIMMVSLLLVGISVLVSVNITQIIGNIENKNEVIVQIKDDAEDTAIKGLESALKDNENISMVSFYSRDEAWEDMKAKMTTEEQELFQYVDSNPLPDTYRIKITDISRMDETTSIISKISGVESVNAPNDFADMLTSLRSIFTIISTVIVIALVAVSLVIISNTTKTSVFARRKEINIMKYVGATNNFIKIPFFVEGTMIGIFAAIGATVATKFAYESFIKIFQNDIKIWGFLGISNLIPFQDISLKVTICYLIAGVALGAIGTVLSTRKHLKV